MQFADIKLVQQSWALLVPVSDEAAELLYVNLFARDPSIRLLFDGDMQVQGRRLMQMIGMALDNLGDASVLVPSLQALGRRHIGYGVCDSHYETVGQALLQTLAQGLGTAYTPEVDAAWQRVWIRLRDIMMQAANEAA
jgi:methyl-accepting chemotaxis protein